MSSGKSISAPQLVDIHCHLDFKEFDKDREEVISRALAEGIWMINVGANKISSERAVKIAGSHDGIFAIVGLHPGDIKEGFDIGYYRELAKQPKVVAIGECGLDYFRIKNSDLRIKDLQKEIFIGQIILAIEVNKPLMIHCREAHEDMLDILKSYFLNRKSKLNGNIHFFSGNWQIAQQYFNFGFTISFAGAITFSRDYDEIIKKAPLEKIMVETDAPFVAPIPYRGKRNEPLYVKEICCKIAEIRGISYGEAAVQTVSNSLSLFDQ